MGSIWIEVRSWDYQNYCGGQKHFLKLSHPGLKITGVRQGVLGDEQNTEYIQ